MRAGGQDASRGPDRGCFPMKLGTSAPAPSEFVPGPPAVRWQLQVPFRGHSACELGARGTCPLQRDIQSGETNTPTPARHRGTAIGWFLGGETGKNAPWWSPGKRSHTHNHRSTRTINDYISLPSEKNVTAWRCCPLAKLRRQDGVTACALDRMRAPSPRHWLVREVTE